MAFKMTGKSPMMKKLIGKQKNLPAELKAKIMAAPESPAKMYGKSPAKNYKNPQDYKVFNMGNEPTPMKQVKPTGKDLDKYSDYEKYDEDGKKITRKQKRAIKKEFKAAKKAGALSKLEGIKIPGKKKSPMKGYKSDAQRKAVHASKADGGKSPAKQGMKRMTAADKKKLQALSDKSKSKTKSIKEMTPAEIIKAGLDKKLGKSPAKQSMKDRAKNVVNKAKNVGSKVVNAMAAPGDPRLKTNRKTDHGKKKSPAKQKSKEQIVKENMEKVRVNMQKSRKSIKDNFKKLEHKMPVARMGGARIKRKK